MKKIFAFLVAFLGLFLFTAPVLADSVSVDFEDPPYTLGVINGQDDWKSLGAAGSGCAIYDHAVDSSLGTAGFGDQSLRISNAVTSGCFGDQTFAKPLADAVGELDSTNGSYLAGTLQRHFEMQFDVASTMLGQQPGLFVSVSPDRGDGSRMSYLGFSDEEGGIDIIFYDVQGTDSSANFVMKDLGIYSRDVAHHIKLTMDMVDGPSNDVVKVWIDGSLVHTGTSWENYYRYDNEASAEPSPRIVKSIIFRTGGSNAPDTGEHGYLFDNLSLSSGSYPRYAEITSPTAGQYAYGFVNFTAYLDDDDSDSIQWAVRQGTCAAGTNTVFGNVDGHTEIATINQSILSHQTFSFTGDMTGMPLGMYCFVYNPMEDAGESNIRETVQFELVQPPISLPTDKSQCKKNGWIGYGVFKNQGDCVSYVATGFNNPPALPNP